MLNDVKHLIVVSIRCFAPLNMTMFLFALMYLHT